jgi:large subunit ribosomal protein L7/L12
MANLDKLVEELSGLTVMEAAELKRRLEEAWGVESSGPDGDGHDAGDGDGWCPGGCGG